MNAQTIRTRIRRAYMTLPASFDAFLEYAPGALLVVGGLAAIGIGAA
jgi:hypothetical protein